MSFLIRECTAAILKTSTTVLVLFFVSLNIQAYPLDGFEDTGIRRTEGARLAHEGIIRDMKQVPGAMWSTEQVDLRLLNHKDFQIPAPDPILTRQLENLLSGHLDEYGVVILDMTKTNKPRFAEHRGDYKQNVGSVGKILVALGLFQALADTWPDDNAKRIEVLKNTLVTADDFSQSDHHTYRVFDLENKTLTRKRMQIGDQGSQYEFLDWMLSVSSNAAASMNQRQAMLLTHYGKEFPPSEAEIKRFFKATPSKDKTTLFKKSIWEPVTRNGMDINQFRQGSFFTRGGKQKVYGGGNSYGTANEILKYLVTMEKGELIDEFSSRQIKRLLYLTERRIRYASSPALKNSAVYYKSGSLYKCEKEAGYQCGAYRGNVYNYMNSMAIIESPPEEGNLRYIVVVVSNILRKNSAVEHQTLGTRIHQLMQKAHPVEAKQLAEKK